MNPSSSTTDDRQLHKLGRDLAANPSLGSSSRCGTASTYDSSGRFAANSTDTPAASTVHHSTCSSRATSSASHGCTCSCAAAATAGPSQPWLGLSELTHLQHLQLQHLQPSCVRAAVHALSTMHGLVSLSITGLTQASASLLLMPRDDAGSSGVTATPAGGAASAGEDSQEQEQWLLAQLQELPRLTRLEIG